MRVRRRVPDSLPSPAPSVLETAKLVTAARAGDRAAFGALYERYARMVHGVLLASAQQDDVQDLVQDVFFRALRQLHALREPAAFGAWIATIARNEARMHHRAEKPTEELSHQHPDPGANEGLAPDWPGTDDVLRALRAVPERYREPLTLRLVEQMGGEEIAARLGLTHGTVRVYLHHGLRLLREQLGAPHD
ncbi:MAG: sigma-70 family RNA polymerase sigma factor [Gemmatimonadaceae bacterium]|nr:sigma-70 family RNA polymerase sigma factor [Gemmatimonadaceae bacterium]